MESNWEPEEDRKLLNSLLKHGIDKWDEVAEELKPRSSEDVKKEFLEKYSKPVTNDDENVLPDAIDHTEPVVSDAAVKIEADEDICKEILYHPLRDEFDVVYDSDAEDSVPVIASDVNDKIKLRNDLKIACFQMYQDRLKRRQKANNLIKNYDLINGFKEWKTKPKLSKLEKFLKLFSSQLPPVKYKILAEQFQEEQKCRSQVEKLMRQIEEEAEKYGKTKESNSAAHRKKVSFWKKSKDISDPKDIKDIEILLDEMKYKIEEDIKLPELRTAGEEILNPTEKKLCLSTGLNPNQFMALKMVILKESEQGGKLPLPYGLNINDVMQVLYYFAIVGWLP